MKLYKSKAKVSALIIVCFTIGLMGVWYILLGNTLRSTKTAILSSIIVVFAIIFSKAFAMYKHYLVITDTKVIFHDKKTIEVLLKDVSNLTYHGTKIIPISEMIGIHAGLKIIYIDFNFKNYRSIWKEVVQRCEGNENIQIDPRIYNRLP